MIKQKLKNKTLSPLQSLAALFVVSVFATAAIVMPMVNADSLQSQINKLQEENAHSHDEVNALQIYARNIEEAINKLQARINDLQNEIRKNQAKSAKLQDEIVVAEKELERQKGVLGQNIKVMYLEGQITTLEMLATSKDLSQFVDKQQYREVVRSKIKDQVDKITALRLKLQKQREEVEGLIKKDKELRGKIAAQKAEQNRLLAMNKAEQAEFNAQIRKNNKKIDELRAAQAALAAKLRGGVFVSLGPVSQGDVIGAVGNTGFSTGAHLHLEALYSNGNTFNPDSRIGGSWIRPVSGGYVSQGYWEYNTWYPGNRHTGIDYAGVTGAPVRAVASGKIIHRGCSQDSEFFGYKEGYGYSVVIQHHDGTFSVYGHMTPPSSGSYEHCSSSYGF